MHTSNERQATDHPPPFLHSKRYRPLSQHYRERFGTKVFKVSVSVAETCPNREGLGGMRVCVFCDEWGSAAYHQHRNLPLREQIRVNREAIRRRYRAEHFLVYFQAYTNTFGRIRTLQQLHEEALAEEDVVGVVVGTRPDCLPRAVLRTMEAFARERYLSVELGVQTLDDAQLKFLSRGHDRACSLAAIRKLKALSAVNVCVHLMFGLPGETDGQLRETAALLSELKVDGSSCTTCTFYETPHWSSFIGKGSLSQSAWKNTPASSPFSWNTSLQKSRFIGWRRSRRAGTSWWRRSGRGRRCAPHNSSRII